MAIAVLTNRFVQVQSFCDYVNLFFVPPFPHLSFKGNSTHNNQPSFIVKSNKYKVWKYSQTEQERNTVLNIPFSTFLRGSSIVFSTYSDITMSSHVCCLATTSRITPNSHCPSSRGFVGLEFTVDLVTIVVQSKSLIVLYHYQSSEDPSYTVSNRYADPIRREEGKLCGEGDVGNQGNVERCSDCERTSKEDG